MKFLFLFFSITTFGQLSIEKNRLIIYSKKYEIIGKVLLYTDTVYECKNDISIRISKTTIFIYGKKTYKKYKK